MLDHLQSEKQRPAAATAVRVHREIEGNVHWVLAMISKEDA
jgi:predicted transposase YbfD/YdcC